MRPNASRAAANMASTWASCVTSQRNGTTAAPSSFAVSCSRPLMSAANTRAPSRTKARAEARAIPEPAPVMTATLPSSSFTGDPFSRMSDLSADGHGEGLPPANGLGGREHDLVVVDLPIREAVQDLVEHDPSFEARQRGAETEVDAVAEGEVLADVAVDVEAIGMLVGALVAVGRSDEEQHRAAGGHDRAVVFDVARHVASDVRADRLEPHRLFDRVGEQRAICHQLPPLVGMVAEHLAEPADEAAGRLAASAGEHLRVGEHLGARERTQLAVLVLELGV